MLKSCGARGVGVASLVITVDEEHVKWARFFWAGGLLTEGMPHGLFRVQVLRTCLCKAWEPR
jgi:hypothetical protein